MRQSCINKAYYKFPKDTIPHDKKDDKYTAYVPISHKRL